jgi:hypothetical protein
LGLVGGSADWLFLRGDVVSLTVSAAAALAEERNEAVAERLWRDTAQALALPSEPAPLMRVIKERRATFAQTPTSLSRRPPAIGRRLDRHRLSRDHRERRALRAGGCTADRHGFAKVICDHLTQRQNPVMKCRAGIGNPAGNGYLSTNVSDRVSWHLLGS